MGTTVDVLAQEPRLEGAMAAVRGVFEEWDETFSRFRPASDLARLNAAAGRPFRAGPLLFRGVARAVEGAQATGGLFDPTLLFDLERIGYDRTFARVAAGARAETGALPAGGGGWQRIRQDRRSRTIELPPGVAVDLGGIAKGLCVDAAIERLAGLGHDAALVSAGGDLRALGVPPAGYWPVAVGEGHQVVHLAAGAVATSGRIGRAWRQGDRRRHHLLDPRSGEPALTGLRLVSVVAGTCGHAEVAAKAAFLLGSGRGASFLASRGLAGLFVADDGTASVAGSWPVRSRAA
jgi:thiamine biosynthesis lipoprotein